MRRGRFEQADGGTLFLDEIGDMPYDLQTRLLRVLSDGQFYRVGGHQPLKSNVRVIAATHQNLEERVRAGSFREDLFHRLNVIRLRLPPLRERAEDIPMLTRFFLQKSAQELGVDAKRIADDALQRLMAFDFPGNVRQLENLCHWLTVMAPSQVRDCAGRDRLGRRRRRGLALRPAARGARPARVRRTRGLGQAVAEVRRPADPHGPGGHARPAHRGGAQAGHRPQHDHAQDPGTRAGRLRAAGFGGSRAGKPALGPLRAALAPDAVQGCRPRKRNSAGRWSSKSDSAWSPPSSRRNAAPG